MKVAIIKYNAGNVRSVLCAMQRLGAEAVLTDDIEVIRSADKVIFPGVGQARTSMDYLNERGLSDVIRGLRQPTLGICIGLQLMCQSSEEGATPDGQPTPCLGIFDIPVVRFDSRQPLIQSLKVPEMGWNDLQGLSSPLFKGVDEGAFVYYVHSYYAPVSAQTIATTVYGQPYSAALHVRNFYATQFHPEKSGPVGQQILQNFLDL